MNYGRLKCRSGEHFHSQAKWLILLQGCCASRQQNDEGPPYNGPPQHNESTQAIANEPAQPLEPITSDPSNLATTSSRRSRNRRQVPVTSPTPVPLRPHIWTSKRQWTRSQLIKERKEFFETRVAGHHDIWETLKVVVELLADGDVALAQNVVDAAEIVVPTGDLKNGAYDSLGNLYQMPEHVVCDPVNVIIDGPEKAGKEGSSADGSEDEEEAERRREEKGKGIVVEGDMLKVKARLSDRGGPDIVVQMVKGQTVRWLIRRILEDSNVSVLNPSGKFDAD